MLAPSSAKVRTCAAALVLLALSAGCSTRPPPGDATTDVTSDADIDAAHCDAHVTTTTATCPVLGRNEAECMQLFLGTGDDGAPSGYREFVPGDSVVVTPGPQGLQHILVAPRGRGFDPTGPLIQLTFVRASDCLEVGTLRFRLPFTRDPADSSLLVLPTLRVTLTDDLDPIEYCKVLGRDVILVAHLDDMIGHRAHSEIRLRVNGIDPNAPPALREAWIAACAGSDGGAVDP